MNKIHNLNITSVNELPKPNELINEIAISEQQKEFVAQSRAEIADILFGNDRRLLIVVGPCSIHDIEAGIEYAQRIKALSESVKDKVLLVMRAYFEKPRTSIGWKGLILDPHLDDSSDIPNGIKIARRFLSKLIEMGIPTATELLDPITPQYIADLISWSAIGARTTESQTHRQLASGLSMPIGFKNSTDGSLSAATHAITAATHPQTFMGINDEGRASYIHTMGNPYCHIVLRGGKTGPNFDQQSIKDTEDILKKKDLKPSIMVDCSHANSAKDHKKQPDVMRDVLKQIAAGNRSIKALMLESNIHEGSQPFPQPKEDLKYGVSITDSCTDWETTEALIREAYEVWKS